MSTLLRGCWQKKPLLIRQAVPGGIDLIDRSALFELASNDAVESRLITAADGRWKMRQGPLARRALPPLARVGWTLLVQGLDLHLPEAHELLARFRFVPDARVDDLMLSYASDGGGVGPHVDSYDVFLLQSKGRRRWRIGKLREGTDDEALLPDMPLKILANFTPSEEHLLEAGDMLYLPPGWGHDGVAEGECMTASIGFRAPPAAELGRELLQRLIDDAEESDRPRLYRDPKQTATAEPGRIPAALQAFASDAVTALLRDPHALACGLGELLSEPKPSVEFVPGDALPPGAGVCLDRRTRMAYDDRFVFINGESFRAAGRDATLMRRLADVRMLAAHELVKLSPDAQELVGDWVLAGWLQAQAD